ncbi:MAG: PAS domain S-box protein [Planctomycetota bacterium]
MILREHLRRAVPHVEAFSASARAEELLREHGCVVVEEDSVFRGLLCACDMLRRPRKAVIDCLDQVPGIAIDSSCDEAIDRMRKLARPALAVFERRAFVGVVTLADLVDRYRSDPVDESCSRSAAGGRHLMELDDPYRTILEHLPGGVAVADPAGRIGYCNRAFLDLISTTSHRAVVGRPLARCWPEAPGSREIWPTIMAEGGGQGRFASCADREERILEWAGAVLRDRSGRCRGAVLSIVDRTTAVRSVDELADTARLFRDIAEANSDAICVQVDGVLRYGNLAMATLVGVEAPSDLLGTRLGDLLVCEEEPDIEGRARRVAQRGHPGELALDLLTAAGGSRRVQLREAPIDHHGRPATVGFIRDVCDASEQERMRSDLTESRRIYRVLVEAARDAIAVHVGGEVVYANPALAAMVGCADPASLVGRSSLSLVERQDRQRVAAAMALIAEGSGSSAPFDVSVCRMDGTRIVVSVWGVAVDYGGQRAILAFGRDVTRNRRLIEQLEASERRYRSLVEHTRDGIAVSDGGVIVYANQALADMLGVPCPQDLHSRRGVDFLAAHEVAEAERLVDRVKRHGGSAQAVFTLLSQPERLLEVTVFRVPYVGRQAIMSIVRDITRRANRQAARDALKSELATIDKFATLGMLVGGIAHEVRAPLGLAMVYARNALALWRRLNRCGYVMGGGERDRADLDESLEQLSAACVRARDTVSGLRSYARPGRRPVARDVDLSEVFDRVFSLIPAARRLVSLAPDVLAVRVRCDPQAMAQVFINLLSNAMRAIDADDGRIDIHVSRSDRMVEVGVWDNGAGVAPLVRGRVFEPYVTAHAEDGGTGLGLAVARFLVEKNGGTIELGSTDEGTTVKVTLPRGVVQ